MDAEKHAEKSDQTNATIERRVTRSMAKANVQRPLKKSGKGVPIAAITCRRSLCFAEDEEN